MVEPQPQAKERWYEIQNVDEVDSPALLVYPDRAEDWLLHRLPGGSHVARRIDINLSTELLRTLGRLFAEHDDRPWELESIFLTR